MKTLNEALEAYYEKFGENYPLCITDDKGNDEIIEDIELCIETNKVAEPPKYEKDIDY